LVVAHTEIAISCADLLCYYAANMRCQQCKYLHCC